MNKSQKIRNATRRTSNTNIKKRIVKIITWPWRACCAVWNWLKSIDVVGMINLTLLVVIIVLFSALIMNFVSRNNCKIVKNTNRLNNTEMVARKQSGASGNDTMRVGKHVFKTTLPIRADKQTNIKPKIKTVGVAKPQIIAEASLPANELPKQVMSGDVIVDNNPSSPILSNGVKINGNLIIQNMRKYTIPCDAKINGHLFVRNARINFCGKFTVNGNIYVNRGSAFGSLPSDAKINGQIVL